MLKEFVTRFGINNGTEVVKIPQNIGTPITSNDVTLLGTSVDNIVFAIQDDNNITLNQFVISHNNVHFEKDINVSGIITADLFVGDGSHITNIDANNIPGLASLQTLADGSVTNTKIADNAVTSSKLDSNITISGNMTAASFYGNGANITNINANNVINMPVYSSNSYYVGGNVIANASSGAFIAAGAVGTSYLYSENSNICGVGFNSYYNAALSKYTKNMANPNRYQMDIMGRLDSGNMEIRISPNTSSSATFDSSTALVATFNGIDKSFTCVGSCTASGTLLTSDDRLKSDEVFIANALETLKKLRPQNYNKWSTLNYINNEEASSFYESGLIAQEIYVDAPELRHLVSLPKDADPIVVSNTADKYTSSLDPTIDPHWPEWGNGIASVNYTGLIPYTIKAIQELDETNTVFDSNVNQVDSRLNVVDDKVNELELDILSKDNVIADLLTRIEKLEAM
jgi:hypothetical protein